MASRGKRSAASSAPGSRKARKDGTRHVRTGAAASTTRGTSKRAGAGHRQREPLPTLDLTRPQHVPDLVYLACFRRRKFARGRFARFVSERIGSSNAAGRFIARIPVETLAVFLAREVRPVSDDREPLNECFELPDGGMLEFAGDHMDAAETVLRLLAVHDENRLGHLVELLGMHDRAWLHTLALEARDARLIELGFGDIDDVDRLFVPWHAPLLIRKLERAAGVRLAPASATQTIAPDEVLTFVHNLREPQRAQALERLHFLMICQAVRDAGRKIRQMTPDNMNRSAMQALRVLAKGIAAAGGNRNLLAGPEIGTVYRLGLAPAPSPAREARPSAHLTTRK